MSKTIEITENDQRRAETLLAVLRRGKWGGKDKELEGTEVLGMAQAWGWLEELKAKIVVALTPPPDPLPEPAPADKTRRKK